MGEEGKKTANLFSLRLRSIIFNFRKREEREGERRKEDAAFRHFQRGGKKKEGKRKEKNSALFVTP